MKTSGKTHPILNEVSTGVLSVYSYDFNYINSIKEHLETIKFTKSALLNLLLPALGLKDGKYFKPI